MNAKWIIELAIGILFIIAFVFEERIALWERKQFTKIKRAVKAFNQPIETSKSDSEEGCSEIVTPLTMLNGQNAFTVARVCDSCKCVELHYFQGQATIEVDKKTASDCWENVSIEDAKWFKKNMSEDLLIKYLERTFDNYFGGVTK